MPVFYMPEKVSSDLETRKTKSATYADPGMLEGLVGSDPFGRVNR